MVSFKNILFAAAAVAGVVAQEPTGDDAAAQAYWEAAATTIAVAGDSPEKRSALVHTPRGDILKDPYRGLYCIAQYTKPPSETKCSRNNCFRSFLNARNGSDGKHCPKEAYNVCCIWNSADRYSRYWVLKQGYLFSLVPYTKNCKGDGDSWLDVLEKIDDVCGCTLNNEVTVDITSDYYGLRHYAPGSRQCH